MVNNVISETNGIKIILNNSNEPKTVHNTFRAICVWDPRDFSDELFGGMPDGWYKEQYPFIDYVILMTFTGGKGWNEWVKRQPDGKLTADFTEPVRILANTVRQGVLPMIVIGNVPQALADGRDTDNDSYGWGNRCPPADYGEYYTYIRDFAAAITANFPKETYERFIFRVGTESDNFHWFLGSEEEYLKLYDFTVAALTDVLGENITVGPSNLETVSKFPNLLRHCAEGINYYTGRTGTKCDFFSVSHYELFPDGTDIPYAEKIRAAAERVKEYPSLGISEINIGEGQFLSDGLTPSNRLQMAQDLSEYAASWHAFNFSESAAGGISYFANWAYCCDYKLTGEYPVKTPAYYTALLLSRTAGGKLLSYEKTGNTAGALLIEKEDEFFLVCFNHAKERIGKDLVFHIEIPQLTGNLTAEYYQIDRTHNNFSADWLEYSKNMLRLQSDADFDRIGSVYETEVSLTLSGENLDLWRKKKKEYSLMTLEKSRLSYNNSPYFTASLNMPHHSAAVVIISRKH